jgi:hypothetical protein
MFMSMFHDIVLSHGERCSAHMHPSWPDDAVLAALLRFFHLRVFIFSNMDSLYTVIRQVDQLPNIIRPGRMGLCTTYSSM